MDNETFSNKLNKIFNKSTYFDKYGGSFMIALLFVFCFFFYYFLIFT